MPRRTVEVEGRRYLFSADDQPLSTTTTPLAGATVRVTGIWRTPPPAIVVVPAELPNLVSLRPPLYARRDALVGRLRHRDLQPIVGADVDLRSP